MMRYALYASKTGNVVVNLSIYKGTCYSAAYMSDIKYFIS